MKNKKKDLILVLIILAVAACGFFINYMTHKKPAAWVEVFRGIPSMAMAVSMSFFTWGEPS